MKRAVINIKSNQGLVKTGWKVGHFLLKMLTKTIQAQVQRCKCVSTWEF